MKLKSVALLLVVLAVAASALPVFAAPTSLTVEAVVVSQACLGGDRVQVTLQAQAVSSVKSVGFRWDTNNNGRFDTRWSSNPIVTAIYPDEVLVTARVRARNGAGESAQDTVTFSTLRCAN